MATILGRTGCHWCGFEHAHVKRGDGKRAYVHCPDCGLMTQARSGQQEQLLLKGMREPAAVSGAELQPGAAVSRAEVQPRAAVSPPAVEVKPITSTPPAPPSRRPGLWEQLMDNRR